MNVTEQTTDRSKWAGCLFTAIRVLLVIFSGQLFGQSWDKPQWIMWMILISGGLLIPLGSACLGTSSRRLFGGMLAFNMTLVLFQALIRPVGRESTLLAAIWLVWCMLLAFISCRSLIKEPLRDAGWLCRVAAAISPIVGAAWLVAHRANWMPLGFDPLIVLLTAAHFHHAGFTLPLMAGLNERSHPSWWTSSSCVAVLAGVPLVAAGITCTHLGRWLWVEPCGVFILSLGAIGVAIAQIQRSLEKEHAHWVRASFALSGASLLAAMILALGFGLRHVFPHLALTMPQMWATHGSLNAFGFGLCGLVAWNASKRHA